MKIYRWSKKALKNVSNTNLNERFIFTGKDEAILFNKESLELLEPCMFKTIDSHVSLTNEEVPDTLKIRKVVYRMYFEETWKELKEKVNINFVNE